MINASALGDNWIANENEAAAAFRRNAHPTHVRIVDTLNPCLSEAVRRVCSEHSDVDQDTTLRIMVKAWAILSDGIDPLAESFPTGEAIKLVTAALRASLPGVGPVK